MGQVSIKEVAKIAGVSVATVSRVINNKGKYSEKTKEKVLKVIRDTGYNVDASAQSLRTNVTHTIGLLVPDIKNFFFADLVQKIEKNLFDKQYSTIICNTDIDEQKEKAYLHTLENKKVDGIIVISGSYEHGFKFKSSLKNTPYICIDREPLDFSDTVYISSNHRLGARTATEYLFERGSKHPVMVTDRNNSTIHDRIEGFREALENHSLQFNMNKDVLSLESCSLQDFIAQNPQIDSFFGMDDTIAINIVLKLKELGYNVPQDFQVIGFDNIPSDVVLSPTLTTIAQNTDKIAKEAVDNMLDLFDHPENKGNQILIATHLIKRNSTR